MRKWLNDLPIKQKLLLAISTTTLCGLVLMIGGFTAYQQAAYQEQMQNEISILAEIISDRSNAAVIFGDQQLLQENIDSLKLHEAIDLVCIYNTKQTVLANTPKQSCPEKTVNNGFTDLHFHWTQSILVDGEVLGKIYIKSNLTILKQQYNHYLFIGFSITSLAILVTFLLSLSIQRLISTPLLSLAKTAEQIAHSNNYQIRAEKTTNDEVGIMVDAFNRMLEVIESRNAELNAHKLNLEQIIEERTLKLKVANKELEAFSYSVSHDLKAPLRALDGFSQAIMEDYGEQLDPMGQNYLLRIRSASQRMEKLIESMLYLSRVGRQELTICEVDLSAISYKVLSLLHEGNPERWVKADVQPDIIINADPNLMQIVINNLLSNAWKYSQNTLEAIISVTMNDGIVCIADNGAGFDMAYSNKLFGAFQRLHNEAEYDGTGIGLATVARIVHRHGGKIWAEAKPNEGARFYFHLPQ